MNKIANSLLLLLLISCTLLTSCNNQTPVSNETTASTETQATETEELSPYEQMEQSDFDGRTFTIFESKSNPALQVNIPDETLTGEPVKDALFMRDTDIESKYNIVLDYYQIKGYDPIFQNSVLAGDDAYQMVISNGNQLAKTMSTANILADLKSIPYLELEEKWWSKLMAENMQINGKQYLTNGDIAPGMYEAIMCIYLNTNLAEDYGISTDDIFNSVMSGKWTLDELISLSKDRNQDLNQDNSMDFENDFFGIAMTDDREISSAFMGSAGIQLNTIENGNPIINAFDNEGDVNRLEKIMSVAKTYKYEHHNNPINVTFKGGNALFLVHKLETAAVHLRDMEDDYLILPVPKYDEYQDNYISTISASCHCFTGVPVTADSEFVGFIMEAMARYSNEYIRPKAYDLVYTQKVIRDERSNDVLNILLDTTYMELMTVYNFAGYSEALRNVIFKNAELTSTVASIVEASRAELQKTIDELK